MLNIKKLFFLILDAKNKLANNKIFSSLKIKKKNFFKIQIVKHKKWLGLCPYQINVK